MIRRRLNFIETGDPLTIAYQLTDNANGDKWKTILVVLNGSSDAKTVNIPASNWTLVSDGNKVDDAGKLVSGSSVTIPGITAYILHD